MAHSRRPLETGSDPHPDYAAMAETLEILAHELAERAAAEGDQTLAAQSRRLFELAASIRSDLAESR